MSLNQVKAFLKFKADGVSLRDNYVEIMEAVASQLDNGRSVEKVIGYRDVPKLRSSLQCFLNELLRITEILQ